MTKRRGNLYCSTTSSSRDLISPVSFSRSSTLSSRSAIASSGRSPGRNESPAANCVYSLTGSLKSSRSQVRNSSRPAPVISYAVFCLKKKKHTVSLGTMSPSRSNHRVNRAVSEPHRLVLAPLTHQRDHLISMHRPLVEERHHRQSQRIGYLPLRSHHNSFSRYELVEIDYILGAVWCQAGKKVSGMSAIQHAPADASACQQFSTSVSDRESA